MTPPKGPNARPKGEGTIYQRKADGMYCASIELPSPDGRRRRKVVTAKTEAQVKVKLKLIKRDLAKHGNLSTSNVTVEQWMILYFETIALKNVRPRTAATYRTQIRNYIIPAIGKKRLDKLTPAHVRQMHDFITSKPKDPKDLTKGYLSPTTAKQAHNILRVALKYALREKRVTENVATLTDAPKIARPKLGIMTADQGVKVLQTVAGDRLGSRWAAALLTGARQGELLGLEINRVTDELDLSWQLQQIAWEHRCGLRDDKALDDKGHPLHNCGFKRGTDCPKRNITFPADWEHRYLTGSLWLSRPKSNAGWRIIPLVDPLKTIIERRIAAAATEPNPHGLLWTSDPKRVRGGAKGGTGRTLPLDGSPLAPSRDTEAWDVLLKRAGVPDVRLHDARHTAASLLAKAGVPMSVRMRILGHNSAAMVNHYTDTDREQMNDAMSRLSALLPLTPVRGV